MVLNTAREGQGGEPHWQTTGKMWLGSKGGSIVFFQRCGSAGGSGTGRTGHPCGLIPLVGHYLPLFFHLFLFGFGLGSLRA